MFGSDQVRGSEQKWVLQKKEKGDVKALKGSMEMVGSNQIGLDWKVVLGCCKKVDGDKESMMDTPPPCKLSEDSVGLWCAVLDAREVKGRWRDESL
jgi:hypothetical protein